ncbi:FMN-linked oxidoreductase [Tothia fuscella]|uniref:tRNA-dihydrouridine(16/17) synthase [NAD(P)(+)] n=1 Tax=Tothia fuscella TaxID=1048955 RepID=A0A9P4NDX3_9PEZI|nr:FMN-linked oxidoreductase [Tothia fuscella]
MTSATSPPIDDIETSPIQDGNDKKVKLHGRAFYESLGSPKYVLAPMVEQSEFAWRMLTRSFMPPSQQKDLLAYTPMFHSRLFAEKPPYRNSAFQPLKTPIACPPDPYHVSQILPSNAYLDGNPSLDRPLFVQFCSNDPDILLESAKLVQPYCDAVDLNLGCPQGIARRGKYGAFLQEDPELIARMINKLHKELDIPVTAKMRILETKDKTLAYAKTILEAGASIITVHGRRREQKGHNTGVADWSVLRYLRENLPKETVIFANGNILTGEDIEKCLEVTGADAVMSAEGNLNDPSIFGTPPPLGEEGREYWRGRDGRGGYRMDAVLRRYMDIIHKYVLDKPPPERKPLYLPSDPPEEPLPKEDEFAETKDETDGPPKKKRKKNKDPDALTKSPNLTSMQAHCFNILKPLVKEHHNVRDALARCRVGEIAGFENVLRLVEEAVKQGWIEYEASYPPLVQPLSKPAPEPESASHLESTSNTKAKPTPEQDDHTSSLATVERCKRPWWICQPYVRPLPQEALAKGAMTLSKKEKEKLAVEEEAKKSVGLGVEGKVEVESVKVGVDEQIGSHATTNGHGNEERVENIEVAKEGLVCG